MTISRTAASSLPGPRYPGGSAARRVCLEDTKKDSSASGASSRSGADGGVHDPVSALLLAVGYWLLDIVYWLLAIGGQGAFNNPPTRPRPPTTHFDAFIPFPQEVQMIRFRLPNW
jgi:hypothetical protein